MTAQLLERVELLMKKNTREVKGHRFTIPAPDRYPFQWFWDSCFHTIILTHLDLERAKDELRAVLAKPLANGLIPHIIYWDEHYETVRWGREEKGDIISSSWGVPGVSSITQPPLIATALHDLYEKTGDISFLRECYPALRAHYLCLLNERMSRDTFLLGIINPDESGEDNSPRFDAIQGLPSRHTPLQNLMRRIDRINEHRLCNFDVLGCMRKCFWVEDVSFNAITAVALDHLAAIAREIGEGSDATAYALTAHEIRSAMLARMKDGFRFYSLMRESEDLIRVSTWGLFMPLYAGLLTKNEAQKLIETHLLDKRQFYTKYPIPSVALSEPSFTHDDLWRGPTWVATNWFIQKGLIGYEFTDLARELKKKTVALIEQSDFREFYDPRTGAGYGATDFTWGGLVLDMA